MRILMVNKFLYPRAGAETYMLELSQLLKAHGHTVAFFGMDHPDKTALGQTCTVKPIDFSRTNSQARNLVELSKALIQNLKIRQKLAQFCKEFKPDLIHAHNVYNQIAPDIFRNVNIPVIMTAHDYKAVCPGYNLFNNGANCEKCLEGSFTPCIKNKCIQNSTVKSFIAALTSWYHKKTDTYNSVYDRIIAPSHFMKKKLVQGGLANHKIDVLHNFTQGDNVLSHDDDDRDFLLYAGRICREKGVKTLIDAYENLPSPRPQLKICGTGPLKGELQKYSEAHNLDIEWLGYVKPSKVKQMISQSMAVVVPSIWYENCSMTIMESLVLGKPVIASISGGNPELINDGYNGFTFEPGSVEGLSAALRKLMAADLKELENNAGTFGETFFGPEVHYKAIKRIYEKVAGIKINVIPDLTLRAC